MDAHYGKVMKMREDLSGQPPRLYFAYSTILDREAFYEWRAEHSYNFFDLPQGQVVEAVDQDLVFNFPSRWWGGLAAGLEDKKGASIYGMLFEIAAENWPVIQHKEGFISGMAVEKKVRVKVNGQEVEATAFTTSPARASTQGEISPAFVEAIVRGAESAGLPAGYVDRLKSLA